MNAIRILALATVTGAGIAVKAMNFDTPQGGIIEMLPRADGDDTCAELPKLCTGPAMMYGYATTVTYLCPEPTKIHKPSTVHVTITKTTTVTPSTAESTAGPIDTSIAVTPAPAQSDEPDFTTTIRSTVTTYKTITLVENSDTPPDATPVPAVSITGYLSATIPTELFPFPTELTDDPGVTVQTSIPPYSEVLSTPASSFPTLTPPVLNGTITGIFFSASVANSSLVQPTAFFPNSTYTQPHYAVPTLNVENRATESDDKTKGAAGKLGVSVAAFAFVVAAVAFSA